MQVGAFSLHCFFRPLLGERRVKMYMRVFENICVCVCACVCVCMLVIFFCFVFFLPVKA